LAFADDDNSGDNSGVKFRALERANKKNKSMPKSEKMEN
jgi:hypothetical protein